MSRKLVNVLTFLSIVIGEIYLLYMSYFFISNCNILKDEKFYATSVKYVCILLVIFIFPIIIKYLRDKTARSRKFIPDRDDAILMSIIILIFVAIAIITYIVSFLFKSYYIARLNLLMEHNFYNISIYIALIGINIFYIILHFFDTK